MGLRGDSLDYFYRTKPAGKEIPGCFPSEGQKTLSDLVGRAILEWPKRVSVFGLDASVASGS